MISHFYPPLWATLLSIHGSPLPTLFFSLLLQALIFIKLNSFFPLPDYVNGGELFTHLYQREKFTENEVRIYIGEIILALEHLHKNGIIYRDIKLENILLTDKGVKLCDFGFSEGADKKVGLKKGTDNYMAPEVYKARSSAFSPV